MNLFQIILTCFIAAPVTFAVFKVLKIRTAFPGPTIYPLIGNIIPLDRIWISLNEMAVKYGDVYSICIFGREMVVVNSTKAASEIIGKKGDTYWRRPTLKLVELAEMDNGVVFQPNHSRHTTSRRILHNVLNNRALESYDNVIQQNISKYVEHMKTDPTKFISNCRLAVGGITLRIAYGHEVQSPNDSFIGMALQTVKNFAIASTPGGSIVDLAPFLARLPSWLPGMNFKTLAEGWKTQYRNLRLHGHNLVKVSIANNTAKPSLTSIALLDQERPKTEEYEDIIMYTAAEVFTGGSDTTVSTMSFFFLAMTRYPYVQTKAQEEIDRVIGRERLPAFQDIHKLPYNEALLKELLRCFPPVPTILRQPSKDDLYRGTILTKGTYMLFNIWGMLHDPNIYEEPKQFNPDRWMRGQEKNLPDSMDVAFGFGRRSCPGKLLAQKMLFGVITATLSQFTIGRVKNEYDEEVIPEETSTTGGIISASTFACTVAPRDSLPSHANER